jgi:hypothetical protein
MKKILAVAPMVLFTQVTVPGSELICTIVQTYYDGLGSLHVNAAGCVADEIFKNSFEDIQ